MKLNNILIFLSSACLASLVACGSSNNNTTTAPTTTSCPAANTSCTNDAGPNAIPTSSSASVPLYIGDASTTGQWSYPNEPLVSVTICTPNHTLGTQCQTISNILLDTGSSGLRVFASAINSNVQLAQQTVVIQGETANLAECAQFGTGADWGSVENGDVMLGNQTATNIPIQVINVNYSSIPSGCASLCPDTDPCTAGYNGILGVGVFAEDCGSACSSYTDDSTNPGTYFACDTAGCYNAYAGNCGSDQICIMEAPDAEQVVNPVAHFASGYNNGVSLTLPSVAASGASAITSGILQLGIGTSPSLPQGSLTVYPADPDGMLDGNGPDMTTVFNGATYGGTNSASTNTVAFIDSGSNGIYFPDSSITVCTDDSGFYCPSLIQSLSATMEGYNGTPSGNVSFSVANSDTLFNSGNSAFSNLCGPADGEVDWGLSFFYGRTVYVGLNGTTSKLNSQSQTGPFWAF